MIDSQTVQILQKHIRRTGRSFLNYVHESYPWSRGNNARLVVDQVKQMVQDERAAAGALAHFLSKHRSNPPYLGAYPMNFTSYNFLEMDRLIPLLLEHHTTDLADLESDLAQVKQEEAYALLHYLVDVKKRHRHSFQELKEKFGASPEKVS